MATTFPSSAIEQLLKSPRLAKITAKLQAQLNEEKERRIRFYEEITEDDKIEFINGEVVLQSPAMLRHTIARMNISRALHDWIVPRGLGFVGDEKMLVALTRNDYEPDVCFFRKEVADTFTPEQMRFPAPDLIAEVISRSTEDIDRGIKSEDYAIHGVREYWIVDPKAQVLEQYVLPVDADEDEESCYELRFKSGTGSVLSAVLPGCEIEIASLFV